MADEEIAQYIKRRKKDNEPPGVIWHELLNMGYRQSEIHDAFYDIDNEKPEGTDIKPHMHVGKALLFMALAISIFGPYAYGHSAGFLLFIAALGIFLKSLLYSTILYVLLMIANYSERTSFNNCFVAGLTIAVFSLITVPLFKYIVIAFTLFLVVVAFRNATIKTYIAFMIFLLIFEIFYGMGLVAVEGFLAGHGADELGITTQRYCLTQKLENSAEAGYVETNTGRMYDQCLKGGTIVDSCDDCAVIELTCLFMDLDKHIIECPHGCSSGACY